ncbi:MAG: TIGR03560 family F420-dependent LLM class oxidoreductase [Nitrososphaerales archaeon]
MKFGYQQPSHNLGERPFEKLKNIALFCEEECFDSFWIMDHLVQIEYVGKIDDPILEPYTALSAVAATTSKIKLGALCTCNFFRNPALLAKMVATVDVISSGRFWLGIGAGWFRKEAEMFGYDYPEYDTRVEMLEESLKIIRGAFSTERFTFKGKYYKVKDFIIRPRPARCPPILIGGGSKKILGLVAKYGDACNLFPKGEELRQKLDFLEQQCTHENRDYSSVLKTKLASVMFGRDRSDALTKLSSYRPRSIQIEEYSSSALLGNTRELIEEIEEYENSGIDYLIINFRGKYSKAIVKSFSRQIMRSF